MHFPNRSDLVHPLAPLMEQLKKMPGIGNKSSQRLAYFLMSMSQVDVQKFADILAKTRQEIRYCEDCFNLCYEARCHICSDPRRRQDMICVVSDPQDLESIEQMGAYHGVYHVLGGLISPLDGMYPELLRCEELLERVNRSQIQEVIFAINPTIEGDTTMLYLKELLKGHQLTLTHLAYGLPMGSDIDYADSLTLEKAFQGRRLLSVQ